MSVIVTDAGFGPDTNRHPFATSPDIGPEAHALDLEGLENGADYAALLPGLQLIRITFAAFNDGRGFTLGADLRCLGYAGILRARGPLLADQYTMLRRTGFDQVEIPDDIAARQPESQWRFRADWRTLDHRARLVG